MLDSTNIPVSIDDINEMAYEGASIHEIMDELKVYPEEEQPVLIVIGGRSGSGKSTVAKKMASDMGAVNLSSDARRKALFECDVHERLDPQYYLPPKRDEDGNIPEGVVDYTQEHRENMEDEVSQVLYAGKSVVVDSTSTSYMSRKVFEELAESCGAKFVGVFLDVPRDVASDRVHERMQSGPDASDMTPHVHNQIENRNDDILKDKNRIAREKGYPEKEDLVLPCDNERAWIIIDGRGRPQDVYAQALAKAEQELDMELVETPDLDDRARA